MVVGGVAVAVEGILRVVVEGILGWDRPGSEQHIPYLDNSDPGFDN